MPKYRKLHVRITESHDVNDMPDDLTRLLWSWLPLILDREGRCIDSPALVRSKLFPLRTDVSADQVGAALDWFAARTDDTGAGMIVRYEARGRRYFWVPSFSFYQGDTRRESESIYPAPPLLDPSASDEQATVTTNSRPAHEQVATKSCSESSSSSDSDSTSTTDADSSSTANAVDEDAAPLTRRQALVREYELLTGGLSNPKANERIDELEARPIPVEWVTEARQIIQERRDNGQRINDPWKYMLTMVDERLRESKEPPRASPRRNGFGQQARNEPRGYQGIRDYIAEHPEDFGVDAR